MSGRTRAARVGELIGVVAAQALRDWGARRVALLDDGSPEADWAARVLKERLGAERVERVGDASGVAAAAAALAAGVDPARLGEEARRLRARLLPDALPAHPANKTALLLGGPLPPEPFLPLGDLYASEVAELAGGWSAPAAVRRLAEGAGGIERLDEALRARIDRRDPAGLRRLPPEVWPAVEEALRKGAAARLTVRLVPKLGFRTLGADLWE